MFNTQACAKTDVGNIKEDDNATNYHGLATEQCISSGVE